jgi:signal peptidase I
MPSSPDYAPSRMITPERKLEALQHVNRRRGTFGFLWDWARIFTVSVLLFFGLRTFVVEAFKIPSGSMERTLLVGDFLLVNKVVYGAEVPLVNRRLPALRHPRRGDVIVFEFPKDRTKNYVKRLIGLAGDTVAMRNGILIRNGVALAEPYVSHVDPESDPVSEEFRWQDPFVLRAAGAAVAYHPSRNNWGPLVVPEAHYFVLGDNRDNSHDSRYWGFAPDSLVRGRPEVVYFSFSSDPMPGLAWLAHVRWARFGELVR